MRMNRVGSGAVGVVVLIFVAVILGWFVVAYNTIVTKQKAVEAAWGDVEAQLQRRLDLVPNLVNTVKGYAVHEKEVLLGVTKTRAMMENLLKGNGASPEKLMEAKSVLDGEIERLLALVENYPYLKADQNFLALQDQLEGTENRIAVARERYNYAVADYNRTLEIFPHKIIAKVLGFRPKEFFKATNQANKPAEVKF